jgi:hypothetical protein
MRQLMASAMKMAPNSPPLHAHQGMRAMEAAPAKKVAKAA